MHLSPFVPSVTFGRNFENCSAKTFSFFKVPLKSMHLSPFVPSAIFGRKFENYSRPLFLFFLTSSEKYAFVPSVTFRRNFENCSAKTFSFFKVPLKSMHLSPFVPSVIFGRKFENYFPATLSFFLKFLWKVCTFHHLSHRLFSEGSLKIIPDNFFFF